MYADDTIAAIATPPGPGGIGIIRISGPLSASIGARVFVASGAAAPWESHRLYHGQIVGADGEALDDALAVLMRRPRSYTGEDVLELQCHGSPLLLREVLAQVLRRGARLADPGEFTRRAFLNGRLDLVQAEAVCDLIHARTTAGALLAARQIGKQLSDHLATLRTELVGLKALLEAQIDFPEEDVGIAPPHIISTIDSCLVTIHDLVETFARGTLLRDGLRVAIVGKPNVGKSSLLNALLGEDRAIVAALPGTTRDSIEAAADFDGVPVRLTDTAGLREPGRADSVERLGMERTTAKIEEAQVLLAVLDAAAPLDNLDEAVLKAAAGTPRIVVLNKVDLPQGVSDHDVQCAAGDAPVVHVSARTRAGLDALRQAVVMLANCNREPDPAAPVLTNLRHRDALEKALRSLSLARASLCADQPADLVAVDVQDAIDHVGSIAGIVTSEDVLDRVFSQFCIGK